MVEEGDAPEEHPMIQTHGLVYLEVEASGLLVSNYEAP
jgi:hypothetical protein